MPEAVAKPTLTLGLRTIPLKLQAFKAKIGVKSYMEACEPQAALAIVPPRLLVRAAEVVLPVAPDAPPTPLPAGAASTARAPKKHHKHPHASALPWPPRSRLFAAIELSGEPVSAEATRGYADPKAAELAARFWCRLVARAVAELVPEDRRQDAELFVMRHRLTVLNAFHRRLKKASVVEAISKLFLSQSMSQPNISHVPEIN
jgi:hypothetical protein